MVVGRVVGNLEVAVFVCGMFVFSLGWGGFCFFVCLVYLVRRVLIVFFFFVL